MFIGAFDGGVEAARKRVLFDLAVPLVSNELLEPLGKTSQFGWREFGNNRFEFFNAHGRKIQLPRRMEKKRFGAIKGVGVRLLL